MKKILILAANPTDTNKLRLDEEVREIQSAHRQAKNREEIEITSQWALRVDDLRREILYHTPNIVHFCGHGVGDDGLVLENEYGQKQLVSSESLAGLFKLFHKDVECVVLNACYSEVQAEAIHQHINCVIGMSYAIGDKAAIKFATGFYDALSSRRNYQDSFEFGCNAIDLTNIPESQIPQIKIKDISKSLLNPDSNTRSSQNENTGTGRPNSSPEKTFKPIKYIPKLGSKNFVGRQDELAKIHQKFDAQNNKVVISAVSGMGGVGKTELAVQYAKTYENNYPGGICWLNARDGNVATEIIQFIQLQMGLEVPQKDPQGNLLTLKEQVTWCWTNWKPLSGLVLVILDDVTQLEDFSQLLPTNKRFRVVITTRLRDIDTNVEEIALDVLSPQEALELFTKLVGKTKVNKELETAQEICEWLGYLPLGIELVGRYIKQKPPHFKLAKMLEQLKQQRLHNQAIKNPQQKSLTTAQRGVLEAFELSWVALDSQTQQLAALIGLFVPEIFLWEWVESITQSLNWDESDIENGIEELYHRHLVQCLEQEDEYYYKTHPLIREFLQTKLNELEHKGDYIQSFCAQFIEIGKTIPHTTTSEIINSVKNAIPHLTEVAENHLDAVRDENLCSVFLSLGRFYRGQGLYELAQPWFEQCVSEVRSHLGENHLDYAKSLNSLAVLHWNQGKYQKAESLYIQALEIRKQQLGENHPHTADSLNNLAILYKDQGKYVKAEPLYTQALEIRKQQLGVNHPHTADSLNNLALLYEDQGKYVEAKPLYIQALEIRKQQLGVNHPHTAQSLNNLAIFYCNQGKYLKAEPLYIQGLEIRKQQLGENHPHTANSLEGLAILYSEQGKYLEAEPLYIQALKIGKQQLGENHLETARTLGNLGELYTEQGKYEQAELLLTQALDIRKQQLGNNHPDTADSLNALGLLYSYQGKHSEAENLLNQALAIAQRVLGSDHPYTVKYRENLEKLRLHE